jgi:outer membrane protein insertion porin family
VLRASVNYSTFSKSAELGFTEPYLFDRNIAVGVDVFRRDFNSFNFIGNNRNTTYEQLTTGSRSGSGVPLTEFLSLALRYGLSQDKVSLDRSTFFSDTEGDGIRGDSLSRCLRSAAGRAATSATPSATV